MKNSLSYSVCVQRQNSFAFRVEVSLLYSYPNKPWGENSYSSHDLIRFSQFLFLFFSLTFTLLVEEISISSDSPSSNNDCIKHIIFSSSWVCGAKEKMCEQVYILLSYFCSTLKYEKQFSSSYIIMYLTPRWLQCRAKNEWDEWEDI